MSPLGWLCRPRSVIARAGHFQALFVLRAGSTPSRLPTMSGRWKLAALQSGRGPFLESLMDTELYSIGAYFCDEHPELVDEVSPAARRSSAAGSRPTPAPTRPGSRRRSRPCSPGSRCATTRRSRAEPPGSPRVLLALGSGLGSLGGDLLDLGRLRRPAVRSTSAGSTTCSGSSAGSPRTAPYLGPAGRRDDDHGLQRPPVRPLRRLSRSTRSTRWSRSTPAPARRGWSSATSRSPPTTPPWRRSRPRPPACRTASGSTSTPSSATRTPPGPAAIDEEFLREVAEAVPELDPDQWARRLPRPGRARIGSAPTRCSPRS